jgi:anti-sigma B factor antagonist
MGDDAAARLREPPVRGLQHRGDALVVLLGGELDLYNADEVRTVLAEAIDGGTSSIVVDLAEVEFVDSTALGVLLEARSRLGAEGLALAGPRLEIRRALEVSGLDRHLAVHDSVDQALGR